MKHGLLALIILAAFLLIGRRLVEAVWHNAGFVALNHGLLDPGGERIMPAAVVLLEQATALWRQPSTAYGLALGVHAQGDSSLALALWDSLPDGAERVSAWGNKQFSEQSYSEALSWYGFQMQLDNNLADGWYFSGRIHQARGANDLAKTLYLESVERERFETIGLSDIYFDLYLLEIENTLPSSDAAVTLAYLANAVAIDSFSKPASEAEARLPYAEALLEQEKFQEALEQYQRIVELRPDNWRNWWQLGRLLWSEQGEADAAEQTLLEATRLNPDRRAPFMSLGDLYVVTGRRAEAIEMYRRVLALDPNDRKAGSALQGLNAGE